MQQSLQFYIDWVLVLLAFLALYLLVRFALRFLFTRHWNDPIARHFSKFTSVDIDRVRGFDKSLSNPPLDFSTWEMLASLCYLSQHHPIEQAKYAAINYGREGWGPGFDHDFYDKLNRTAASFSIKRWHQRARDLLTIGIHLSQEYPDGDWPQTLETSLRRELSKRR